MSIKYDQYLESHRTGVSKALSFILENVPELYTILPDIFDGDSTKIENTFRQIGTYHDASKYRPEEYIPYDNYFYPRTEPISDDVKRAFNFAWLHHIHHNPHHWQYWVLINDDDGTSPLEIPDNYILEMICDWMAFSIVKGNPREIFEWYDKAQDKQIMNPESRKKVNTLLHAIKEAIDRTEKEEKDNDVDLF